MPMPPLLLADLLRRASTPSRAPWAEGHDLDRDRRPPDAWYLHEGRMPAGILIESGQADLMLIS